MHLYISDRLIPYIRTCLISFGVCLICFSVPLVWISAGNSKANASPITYTDTDNMKYYITNTSMDIDIATSKLTTLQQDIKDTKMGLSN